MPACVCVYVLRASGIALAEALFTAKGFHVVFPLSITIALDWCNIFLSIMVYVCTHIHNIHVHSACTMFDHKQHVSNCQR